MKAGEELLATVGERVRAASGTTRILRRDGTSVEVCWDGAGRITVTEHIVVGIREYVGEFDASGEFRVVERRDERRSPATALASRTRTNAYGTAVEREEFPYFAVERTFDDNARLCRTSVTGDWGELVADVRTDGSRALRWHLSAIDMELTVSPDGRADDPVIRRAPKEHP